MDARFQQNICLLCERIIFHGKFFLAASHVFGEAGIFSDIDCHLVAYSLRELFRLVREKETICHLKQELSITPSFILSAMPLVRHKLYFVEGWDAQGAWYCSPYDARLLRNTALKVAYREFFLSRTTAGEASVYHAGKALLQALWSLAFGKHIAIPYGVPLFSIRGIREHVLPDMGTDDEILCQRILCSKLSPKSQISQDDCAYVFSMIEKAYDCYTKHPFSFPSYILYSIFSLKDGHGSALFSDPDRKIIRASRKALLSPQAPYSDNIFRQTIPMIII